MKLWPFQNIRANPSQLTKNYQHYKALEETRNILRKVGFLRLDDEFLDEMDSLWDMLSDYEKEKINNNDYDK